MTLNEQYLVDVIGFNPVERSMLASIFALAARRDPGFVQYDPASTVGGSADIYLVDAENPDALNEFRTLSKRANLPAVMVGAGGDSMGFPRCRVRCSGRACCRPWRRRSRPPARQGPRRRGGHAAPGQDALGQRRRPLPSGRQPAGAGRGGRQARALGDTVLVVDDNASVRMFMKAKLAPSTSRWISRRPARRPWA